MTFKEAYTKANNQIHADRHLLDNIGHSKKKPVCIRYLYAPAAALAALVLLVGIGQVRPFTERKTADLFDQSEELVYDTNEDEDLFIQRALTMDEAADEAALADESANDGYTSSPLAPSDYGKGAEANDVSNKEPSNKASMPDDTHDAQQLTVVMKTEKSEQQTDEQRLTEKGRANDATAMTETGDMPLVMEGDNRSFSIKSAGAPALTQSKIALETTASMDEFLSIGHLSKSTLVISGMTASLPEAVAYSIDGEDRIYEDVVVYFVGDGCTVSLLLAQRSGTPFGPDGSIESGIYAGFQCGALFVKLEAHGLALSDVQTIIQTFSH